MLLCIPPSFSFVRSSPVAIQMIKYCNMLIYFVNNKIKEFIGGPQRYTMIVLFGPMISPVLFSGDFKAQDRFLRKSGHWCMKMK